MLVAGRISPKNSPCAVPISFPLRNVRHEDPRPHHIFQTRSRFRKRRFDVPNRLHRLRVRVSHSHNFSVRARCRRPRNGDHVSDFHRPRVPTIGSHGVPLEIFSRAKCASFASRSCVRARLHAKLTGIMAQPDALHSRRTVREEHPMLCNNILEAIGHTPLVRLNRITQA